MTSTVKTLWIEHYKINSLLVNSQGRLGLYGVLNLLQETAWIHAETLGFGMEDMEKKGLYWVLTRQTLKMKDWPSYGHKISIETWLKPPEGAFAGREFLIKNEAGEKIGACTTSWLALDRNTKGILHSNGLHNWNEICRKETTGMVAEKISVSGEYHNVAHYRVRNSDLDSNQHVNNTKYSQWILDSIPYELHKKLVLTDYSVNFLAETHLGDEVEIDRSQSFSSEFEEDIGVSSYRGLRFSDKKVLFTAKLAWRTLAAKSQS